MPEMLEREEVQRRPLPQKLPSLLVQRLWPHRGWARWLMCLRFFEETWSQQPLEVSAEDDLVTH